MPAGFKIDALDPLVTPIEPTDLRMVGRGTQTYRTPIITPDPPPTLLAVMDAGPAAQRCMYSSEYSSWWDMANMPLFLNGTGTSWTDVIYVPSLKMFFATGSVNGGDNRNTIARSRDGKNWAGCGSNEASVNNAIAYSPALGRLVVARSSGVTTSDRIFTSDDQGMTWTNRTLPTASITLRCIAWSPTLNLFVAGGSSNAVFTSPDGITWTQRTGPTGGLNHIRVAWVNFLNKFVMTDGNNSTTSADGITWTASVFIHGGNTRGFAVSESLGMIVVSDASSNNVIKHSTNATTWTTDTVTGGWHDVVWSPSLGLFVAVGGTTGAGGKIATSPDGDNWTILASSPIPNSQVYVRLCASR